MNKGIPADKEEMKRRGKVNNAPIMGPDALRAAIERRNTARSKETTTERV